MPVPVSSEATKETSLEYEAVSITFDYERDVPFEEIKHVGSTLLKFGGCVSMKLWKALQEMVLCTERVRFLNQ